MSQPDRGQILAAARTRRPVGAPAWFLSGMVLLGAVVFLYGIGSPLHGRAWQALLINLVFWTGLCCGAILISAVLVITKANWGRSIQRLAEAPVFFLPIAFVLFLVLFLGRDQVFPWLHDPLPEKRFWLNPPFFFIREAAVFLLLASSAAAMVWVGVRRDVRYLADGSPAARPDPPNGADRAQIILANVFAIFFAVLLTILAFDLIMSLSPHWYSTLFGAYYFVGSFFCGIAALIIICFYARQRLGMTAFISPRHLHNLGKLLLGFCLITADFFYAQFFIMWYGNLPEESRFVLVRVQEWPWKPVAWTVLAVCFALPFMVLLNRRIKMQHGLMVVLCTVILMGMWLERFLLIAPSLWHSAGLPLGWLEISITLGFFGLLGLSVLFFLSRYPLMPVSDPLFWKGLTRMH